MRIPGCLRPRRSSLRLLDSISERLVLMAEAANHHGHDVTKAALGCWRGGPKSLV